MIPENKLLESCQVSLQRKNTFNAVALYLHTIERNNFHGFRQVLFQFHTCINILWIDEERQVLPHVKKTKYEININITKVRAA